MRLVPILLLASTLTVGASEKRLTPLVRAVQIARDSVVNIHSEKSPRRAGEAAFSGSRDRKVSGMGTGIVVDERGYIVTNHHVVKDVDSLEVTLGDGTRYQARVLSVDRSHDLAIIKIDPRQDLKVMPLGTSSDLMLAESVFAVGNAFGYEHTVTSGIVSALGRDVEVNETQSYYNLIQTDASINPGNSGGPLLNLDGHVIGINVAIRAGAQRIGFAIPIDDARKTVAELMSVERLFGVTAGFATRDIKKGESRRVVVSSVSAKDSSGLQFGDQVVRVDGRAIVDGVDIARAFYGRRVGESVNVQIVRAGRPMTVPVRMARHTRQIAQTQTTARPVSMPRESDQTSTRAWRTLGLRLIALNSSQVSHIAPRYRGGMQVTGVRPGSPAASKGIQNGDYLVGLHIWETLGEKDLAYILADEQLRQHNPLTFYIVRRGKTMFGQLAL